MYKLIDIRSPMFVLNVSVIKNYTILYHDVRKYKYYYFI